MHHKLNTTTNAYLRQVGGKHCSSGIFHLQEGVTFLFLSPLLDASPGAKRNPLFLRLLAFLGNLLGLLDQQWEWLICDRAPWNVAAFHSLTRMYVPSIGQDPRNCLAKVQAVILVPRCPGQKWPIFTLL